MRFRIVWARVNIAWFCGVVGLGARLVLCTSVHISIYLYLHVEMHKRLVEGDLN
jgi:hypothetical protein